MCCSGVGCIGLGWEKAEFQTPLSRMILLLVKGFSNYKFERIVGWNYKFHPAPNCTSKVLNKDYTYKGENNLRLVKRLFYTQRGDIRVKLQTSPSDHLNFN